MRSDSMSGTTRLMLMPPPCTSGTQLEDRVAPGVGRDPRRRRTRRHREIALHGHREAVEIGAQDLRLLGVGHRPHPDPLAAPALAEHPLAGYLRVAYPLRPAPP